MNLANVGAQLEQLLADKSDAVATPRGVASSIANWKPNVSGPDAPEQHAHVAAVVAAAGWEHGSLAFATIARHFVTVGGY